MWIAHAEVRIQSGLCPYVGQGRWFNMLTSWLQSLRTDSHTGSGLWGTECIVMRATKFALSCQDQVNAVSFQTVKDMLAFVATWVLMGTDSPNSWPVSKEKDTKPK